MRKPASAGLERSLRHPAELVEAGLVSPDRLAELEQVASRYALAITPSMARLIDPARPDDPIARQFIPDAAELIWQAQELADPIGDDAHMPVKGIVHRYPDRVLLKPSHVCPVYCRFCFRREMVGPGKASLSAAELDQAYAYIRARPEITEVILTGGDPLMLAPRRMADIITALSMIPHLSVIRLHSRVPVVDPARIDAAMLAALETELGLFIVLHINHPQELHDAAEAACRRIVKSGIPMLSQSVLLKGVNDDAPILASLLRRLTGLRIKPYYLHHGDLAPGTAPFRTSIAEGQAIMRQLQGNLSGICQPAYMLDLPGGHGKVPLGPSYVTAVPESQHYCVQDFRGQTHLYPPGD